MKINIPELCQPSSPYYETWEDGRFYKLNRKLIACMSNTMLTDLRFSVSDQLSWFDTIGQGLDLVNDRTFP